ncbi:MAG: hypothetical protein P1P84_02700 [Deferrisomatales bacterium]|nr:hypothetical protein [Deferrisomatales bacterium]
MAFQDPVKRTEAELEVLYKERETELAQAAPSAGDPGKPPAATDAAPEQARPASGDLQPPAAPATPQTPDDKLAALSHRLDTLQGKYNAEVPRLNVMVRQKDAEIARLTAELDQARKSPAPELAESDEYRALVDEYGEGAAKAMLGLARKEAARASEEITTKTVEPLAADLRRNTFHAEIERAAGPDWVTINTDPKFIGWTHATVEQTTGLTVNALLNDAYASGNATKVAAFFNDYRKTAAPPPNPNTQPPAADQRRHVTDQDAMRAPPSRATSAQSLTDASPDKVWGMAEVNAFYDDQAKGRYRGREKEAKTLEAEIMVAMRDNRVVG